MDSPVIPSVTLIDIALNYLTSVSRNEKFVAVFFSPPPSLWLSLKTRVRLSSPWGALRFVGELGYASTLTHLFLSTLGNLQYLRPCCCYCWSCWGTLSHFRRHVKVEDDDADEAGLRWRICGETNWRHNAVKTALAIILLISTEKKNVIYTTLFILFVYFVSVYFSVEFFSVFKCEIALEAQREFHKCLARCLSSVEPVCLLKLGNININNINSSKNNNTNRWMKMREIRCGTTQANDVLFLASDFGICQQRRRSWLRSPAHDQWRNCLIDWLSD